MKKFLLSLLFVVTFFTIGARDASALTNNTVKVGLRYDTSAMFSANLENAVGAGYSFGYYDEARNFVPVGTTDRTTISMTAAGNIYLGGDGNYNASSGVLIGKWHIQPAITFSDYQEAQGTAAALGGYPAYINGEYVVRIGCYADEGSAAAALAGMGLQGTVVSGSSTGVLVTVTRSATVVFEFDCQSRRALAVLPNGQGSKAVTWFRGYQYYGGFEYRRSSGGNLTVINVVPLEDYVKGVIPYEMGGSWPLAALEAQAICARTYVQGADRHSGGYGFDVCNTADCQAYNGLGTGRTGATATSDQAVDNTAGLCIYANGVLARAVYFSSDGGATESSENVWGGKTTYLIGKEDPYEALVNIPNYNYTVTYTPAELTWIAQNSGHDIGTIRDVYVTQYTELGNVKEIAVVDTTGKILTLRGDRARMLFYSMTYDKSVPSMRFTISGGRPTLFYVNGPTSTVSSVGGAAVISGDGTVTTYGGGDAYVITANGTEPLVKETNKAPEVFTITGTGRGHNVGMSQYGARAMALQGMSYMDILNFYYTGITVA